jgi:hypothetical protein
MSQTLQYLLAGDSEKQIANRLRLSQHTVHVYVKALYRRHSVSSRGELLARFIPHDAGDPMARNAPNSRCARAPASRNGHGPGNGHARGNGTAGGNGRGTRDAASHQPTPDPCLREVRPPTAPQTPRRNSHERGGGLPKED